MVSLFVTCELRHFELRMVKGGGLEEEGVRKSRESEGIESMSVK